MPLSDTFNMAPDEAVRWFRDKGFQLSYDWFDVWEQEHAKAFTVAKAMSFDILNDIRIAAQKALDQGLTKRQFRKLLESNLKTKGWWGRTTVTNPKTNNKEVVQLGSPWRLATIYQTNMQASMMAGRWKQFYDNKRNRPYLQYIAVMDPVTRESHAALHGKIFHIDDPIWQSIWPPNGFNCRCRVRALTERQAKQRGFKEGQKYKQPENFPDLGFDHNHGFGQVANDIKAWKSWFNLHQMKNKPFVKQQMQKHVDQLINLNSYVNFTDKVFKRNTSIGEVLAVGYLSQTEFNFIKGKSPDIENGVLVLRDGLMVGPKADRHKRTQRRRGREIPPNALSNKDWALLPFYLVRKKVVYWDNQDNAAIVLFKSIDDPRWIKLVYRHDEFRRENIIGLTVRTTFYVDDIGVYSRDANRFELIEGGL